jgi:peptidoglycan-N-acetylglucosamine deacetylase
MEPPLRWPPRVRSAVSLTFDLDAETMWISRDPANLHRISVMSMGAYGPKVGVPLILDFLERNGLTATFFVPGWTAERYRDEVAEIHRRGHEVGHHGYLHEGLEGKSREEEEKILAGSASILAEITGTRPVGYRAPLFDVTSNTWDLMRLHDFIYSSNLMDSFWPYLHPGEPPIVELPVQWLLDDGPFFGYGIHPPLYRQIFPPQAVLSAWRDEFNALHRLGGIFNLCMHPQLIGRPSRIDMLQRLVDEMRRASGVWFARCDEVARWVASPASEAGTDGRPRSRPARGATRRSAAASPVRPSAPTGRRPRHSGAARRPS